MTEAADPRCGRNVALYLHYQTARNAIAWLPVFFLYFTATVSAEGAIVLESIYYAVVVAFEVPSGYFSDRLGRRPTLALAMLAWVTACVVFATTDTFAAFVVAQCLMALGMALNSGTDEALLFDSLAALDSRASFVDVEARAQARARVATGAAALVGGLVCMVDYRLAYWLSAASGLVALGVALSMVEPPRCEAASALWPQLGSVARLLRDGTLRWLLSFAVAMTVFDHVVYMFVQPYLEGLRLPALAQASSTPLAAGVITAVTLLISAIASRSAPAVGRALGPRVVLLGAMLMHGAIIGAMAWWTHAAVIGLLVLRAVPPAMWHPIARGLAHPRVGSGLRATYFSVESLAGRLAFSGSLAIAASAVGGAETMSSRALAGILGGFAAATLAVAAALWLSRGALDRERDDSVPEAP
ncbi:MAG: MFS transporter [Myxococcota bacterium]